MPGTGHNPAGSQVPPEPLTGSHEPEERDSSRGNPAEVIEELLNTAERLIGDPVAAWTTIKAEVERRIIHRAEREPSGAEKMTLPLARPERPGQSSGGAMPTHPDMSTGSRSLAEFDSERATFERLKPDLLARAEGEFVVIRGGEVVGPVETYEAALRAGYARFGLDVPFYVRQILAEEPVITISRDISPCRA